MAPNNALKKSRLGEEVPTAPAVPRGSAAAAAGVAPADLDPSFDVTPEWLAQQAADGAAGGRAVSAAEVLSPCSSTLCPPLSIACVTPWRAVTSTPLPFSSMFTSVGRQQNGEEHARLTSSI